MRRIYRRRYAGFSLKQGQGRGDGHQAFTSALAFFFYRTTFLPFSKHLPHPSLSLSPPFFLHPIHHTSPFHSLTQIQITGWEQNSFTGSEYLAFYILIQFSSFCFIILLSFIISNSILFYFYFHFHLLLELR